MFSKIFITSIQIRASLRILLNWSFFLNFFPNPGFRVKQDHFFSSDWFCKHVLKFVIWFLLTADVDERGLTPAFEHPQVLGRGVSHIHMTEDGFSYRFTLNNLHWKCKSGFGW